MEKTDEGPAGATIGPSLAGRALTADQLRRRIGSAAIAFRGYDISNLGRSPELLDHPAFGPRIASALQVASELCAEAVGRPVDLAERIRAREPTTPESFAEDVAAIVALEVAQVRLLDEFFGIATGGARLSFGYSIGELAALVLGGVFALEQVLPVPLGMAEDCAALAANVSMGILFTRGPALALSDVERLCIAVSSQGHGLVGPSAYLSPNTALLLGEGDTLDRLERTIPEFLPGKVLLRRNPHRWPPLHTPLVWRRNIPNRTAMALYAIAGGLKKPSPMVYSCVTGRASYDAVNSRDLLIRWTDHPQRLWDVVSETLESGVDLVVHAGPEPKLIVGTFARLSLNVTKQVSGATLSLLGNHMIPSLRRHAWLARLLPSRSALLRAPFLDHVILEDWLLEQPLP